MLAAGVYTVSLFTETSAALSHLVSFSPLKWFKSLYKFQGQDSHLYILFRGLKTSNTGILRLSLYDTVHIHGVEHPYLEPIFLLFVVVLYFRMAFMQIMWICIRHKAVISHKILLKSFCSLILPQFMYSLGALALHGLLKDFNSAWGNVWASYKRLKALSLPLVNDNTRGLKRL